MKTALVAANEKIENSIYTIRGKRVMLDRDLAVLYGVQSKRLNEQVKRNPKRFPFDCMFQLTKLEVEIFAVANISLKSMGLPYAFITETGVAMLSSVLTSEQAIEVNLKIMRTFIRLREYLLTHKELSLKLEELEIKFEHKNKQDEQRFSVIFEAIRHILEPPTKEKKISFLKGKS